MKFNHLLGENYILLPALFFLDSPSITSLVVCFLTLNYLFPTFFYRFLLKLHGGYSQVTCSWTSGGHQSGIALCQKMPPNPSPRVAPASHPLPHRPTMPGTSRPFPAMSLRMESCMPRLGPLAVTVATTPSQVRERERVVLLSYLDIS